MNEKKNEPQNEPIRKIQESLRASNHCPSVSVIISCLANSTIITELKVISCAEFLSSKSFFASYSGSFFSTRLWSAQIFSSSRTPMFSIKFFCSKCMPSFFLHRFRKSSSSGSSSKMPKILLWILLCLELFHQTANLSSITFAVIFTFILGFL